MSTRPSITAKPDYRVERLESGGVEIVVPRRLDTPNEWNGSHWRKKARITKEWELAVFIAMRTSGVRPTRQETRLRLTIARGAPSGNNFIRDDDNLRFCVKPLLDALKRLGWIENDSRGWVDLVTPTQFKTTDRRFWAHIRIEPLAEPIPKRRARPGGRS